MSLPTDDKARKALPLWTFLTEYFPDAFLEVANVAIKGNEQHNPGEPLHWAREKSTDQMNTAFRHLWDYGSGTKLDTDGQYHLAKAIWRLSAQLQLDTEAYKRAAAYEAPSAAIEEWPSQSYPPSHWYPPSQWGGPPLAGAPMQNCVDSHAPLYPYPWGTIDG